MVDCIVFRFLDYVDKDRNKQSIKGGRMKRDASPKPRETETRPPEELFRILCGIYPLEVAQEVFERLMEDA